MGSKIIINFYFILDKYLEIYIYFIINKLYVYIIFFRCEKLFIYYKCWNDVIICYINICI